MEYSLSFEGSKTMYQWLYDTKTKASTDGEAQNMTFQMNLESSRSTLDT
jgi:hypothetical protein